jgi:hypothetical protein
MSFGGKGSSYQWQQGTSGRDAPRRLEMPYDQLVRGLIGQMATPPETPISTPLQQSISNLQSGNFASAFGLGGGMADRLSGGTGSSSGSGTDGGGFAAGSFSPDAAGGQQGLQTRSQLGLPDRASYFPFMPSADDIAAIGLSPVRTQVKDQQKDTNTINRLQDRIDTRTAQGKGSDKAQNRLGRVKARLDRNTGPTYNY